MLLTSGVACGWGAAGAKLPGEGLKYLVDAGGFLGRLVAEGSPGLLGRHAGGRDGCVPKAASAAAAGWPHKFWAAKYTGRQRRV